MTIQEVEKLTGISRPNIRFYEKEKLLSPGRNSQNGYREYEMEQVILLEKIKTLRLLGISIEDIRSIMEGKQSLSETVLLRKQEAEMQQEQIAQLIAACEDIAEKNFSFDNLDTDLFLLKWNLKEFKEEQVMKEKEKWNRLEQKGKLMSQAGAICILAMLPVKILFQAELKEVLPAAGAFAVAAGALAVAGLILFGISRVKGSG